MGGWADDLAASLGEEPLDPDEVAEVLAVAREVAHGVERRLAPVTAYLLGVRAGAEAAGGGSRAEALARAGAVARGLIPGAGPAEDDDA